MSFWSSIIGPLSIIFLAIVSGTWYLATRLEKIEGDVREIISNHLPHIQKQFRWLYVKIGEFERLFKEDKKR